MHVFVCALCFFVSFTYGLRGQGYMQRLGARLLIEYLDLANENVSGGLSAARRLAVLLTESVGVCFPPSACCRLVSKFDCGCDLLSSFLLSSIQGNSISTYDAVSLCIHIAGNVGATWLLAGS